MQFNLIVAFVAACLAMTVSAAPVAEVAVARAPEPDRSALRLPRIIEEAREPEPGCTSTPVFDAVLHH
ncbi:hypothetical protein B0H13DRAFT_2334268 [Mycena leptocephala]|nr:hypothetical protein B0H13DRAFT_2334268 [Mycena leptocephala]